MVAPVAVGADPDLEQRRLVRRHRPVPGRGEGLDPLAGPDEREAERELDQPAPAGSLAVDEPLPDRGGLALPHAGPELRLDVRHRGGADLVGETDPLDLLRGLERARCRQQRRRVGGAGPRAEPAGREGRRLADHPVGGLRAERELEPDALVRPRGLEGERERASRGRPRVGLVVAAHVAHVLRPGRPRGVLGGRLEAEQDRLALAREDAGVVALHAPEVRQVEHVVGRPDDERVELALRHQGPNPVELLVVLRPAHQRTRGGAGSPCASCHEMTGLRSTPIRSISASITSPGLR